MNSPELFDSAAVAQLLPMRSCIAAVEAAFLALGRGEAIGPVTASLHVPDGTFHIKTGALRKGDQLYFAAKVNGNFPKNRERHGLPTIQGAVLLCDGNNGQLLAIMDSSELTARRTAAATAVAAKYLARRGDAVVTIAGCGMQAPLQLAALKEVLAIRQLLVFDTDPARAQTFATACDGEVVANLTQAAARSDVVITCTTSTEFILPREAVKPGAFVAGVGVDNPAKRELAPSLMAASKVVTDVSAQCAEIGDLHHALQAGVMTLADVHAELGAIVAGAQRGRDNENEIIVFDSTGIGLQDVAAAIVVYESGRNPTSM